MHLRVQRLHAPVHDFRESGELGDLGDRQARRRDRARGAARRDQLETGRAQLTREFDDAGLVGNGEQRPPGVRPRHLAQEARPYSRSFLRRVPRLMPRIVAARLWLPSA